MKKKFCAGCLELSENIYVHYFDYVETSKKPYIESSSLLNVYRNYVNPSVKNADDFSTKPESKDRFTYC